MRKMVSAEELRLQEKVCQDVDKLYKKIYKVLVDTGLDFVDDVFTTLKRQMKRGDTEEALQFAYYIHGIINGLRAFEDEVGDDEVQLCFWIIQKLDNIKLIKRREERNGIC